MLQSWLNEYGERHRNETIKAIHGICVPAIFFSVVGLMYAAKLHFYKGYRRTLRSLSC